MLSLDIQKKKPENNKLSLLFLVYASNIIVSNNIINMRAANSLHMPEHQICISEVLRVSGLTKLFLRERSRSSLTSNGFC